MRIVFWLSVSVVLYSYAGYPIALLFRRLFVHGRVRKGPTEPYVTLVVPAYNESKVIGAKICNAASLDYPADKLEVLIASDASAILESDSIRQFVANFADPEVGAVSGIYRVQHASEARLGSQEEICWRYETFSKIQESNLASVLGGHGQVLGVRKDLYPYPAPGTINDDYVIPGRMLAGGSRVI